MIKQSRRQEIRLTEQSRTPPYQPMPAWIRGSKIWSQTRRTMVIFTILIAATMMALASAGDG
jgi:hypothetical protein